MKAYQHLVVHCRKAKYDVYCGRESGGAPKDCTDFSFGNPFTMRVEAEREDRVELFRQRLLASESLVTRVRTELKGKTLACWCSPKLCHCHVLACVANSPEQTCTKEDLQLYIEYLASSGHSRSDKPSSNRNNSGRGRGRGHRPRGQGRGSSGPRTTTAWTPPEIQRAATSGSGSSAGASPELKLAVPQLRQQQQAQQPSSPGALPAKSGSKAAMPPPQPVFRRGRSKEHIDIGINITSKQLKGKWREIVARAEAAGVPQILLTGTSISCSRESIGIAHTWERETGRRTLYCTVGIHPHDAKSLTTKSIDQMRSLLRENKDVAVAVGECGLDYNRNFSTPSQQKEAFRAQLELACELKLPIFIHEREAHEDLCAILDEFEGRLPPAVVHCFTGTEAEALEYIARGLHIGLTGTICKAQRGAPLRALLPRIPLDRLMVETDAPWMGFVKHRRISEPADVVMVADKVAEVLAVSPAVVSAATTQNARQFFQLPACAVTHQVQPRKTEQRSEVVTQHHAEAGSDARLANGSGGDTTQRARRKGKKRGGRRRTTASSAQGQSMVAAE